MSSNIFDKGSTCGAFIVLSFHSRSAVSESYVARHVERSRHVLLTCSRFDQPGAEPPAKSQFVEMVARLTGVVDAEIKSPRVLDGGVQGGVFWVVREHFREAITALELLQGERGSTAALQSLSDELSENLGRTMAALAVVIGLAVSYTLRVFAERGVVHGALDISRTIALRGDGEPIVFDVGYRDLFGPRFFEHDPTNDYRAPEVQRGEAPDVQSDIWSLGTIVHGLFFAAAIEMPEGEALAKPDLLVKGATPMDRRERFRSWTFFHDALQVFGGKAIDRGRGIGAARPAPSPVKDEVTDIVASGERATRHRNGDDAEESARAAGPVVPVAPGSRTRTAEESESIETNPCRPPVSNQEAPPATELPGYSQGTACIASESLEPSAPSVALSYTREREAFTRQTAPVTALEPVAASVPAVVDATPKAAEGGVAIAAAKPTALDIAAAPDSVPIEIDLEPLLSPTPVMVEEASTTVRVVAPLAAPVEGRGGSVAAALSNIPRVSPRDAACAASADHHTKTDKGTAEPGALRARSGRNLISPGEAQRNRPMSIRSRLLYHALPGIVVVLGVLGLRAILLAVDRKPDAFSDIGHGQASTTGSGARHVGGSSSPRPVVEDTAILRAFLPEKRSVDK